MSFDLNQGSRLGPSLLCLYIKTLFFTAGKRPASENLHGEDRRVFDREGAMRGLV